MEGIVRPVQGGAAFSSSLWQTSLEDARKRGWLVDTQTGELLDDDSLYDTKTQRQRFMYRKRLETMRVRLQAPSVGAHSILPPRPPEDQADEFDPENPFLDDLLGDDRVLPPGIVRPALALERHAFVDASTGTDANEGASSIEKMNQLVFADRGGKGDQFTQSQCMAAINQALERWCPPEDSPQYAHPNTLACRHFNIDWDGLTWPAPQSIPNVSVLNTVYCEEYAKLSQVIYRSVQSGIYVDDQVAVDLKRCMEACYYSYRLLVDLYFRVHNMSGKHGLNTDPTIHQHRPFDPLALNSVQKLVRYFLAIMNEHNLTRYANNWLCEPIFNSSDTFVHCYRTSMTIETFVYKMVDYYQRDDIWRAFTERGGVPREVIDFLCKCYQPELPVLVKDRYVISFRNGLYFVDKDKFHHWHDGALPGNIVACQYHPIDFEPYEGFVSVDFVGNADHTGPRIENTAWDIATPKFDKIMRDQDMNYNVMIWFYALFGRLLYWTGEFDNWQVWPFNHGMANTGKCLCAHDPVMMFDGTRKEAATIDEGDVVMGYDGTPRIVYATTSGFEQLYDIVEVAAASEPQQPPPSPLYSCTLNHKLVFRVRRNSHMVDNHHYFSVHRTECRRHDDVPRQVHTKFWIVEHDAKVFDDYCTCLEWCSQQPGDVHIWPIGGTMTIVSDGGRTTTRVYYRTLHDLHFSCRDQAHAHGTTFLKKLLTTEDPMYVTTLNDFLRQTHLYTNVGDTLRVNSNILYMCQRDPRTQMHEREIDVVKIVRRQCEQSAYAGFELRELPAHVTLSEYLANPVRDQLVLNAQSSGLFALGNGVITHNSTMCEVYQMVYAAEDTAVLPNTIEAVFGLWPLFGKLGLVAPEVNTNFGIDRTDLQSMITGEAITIKEKGKKAQKKVWRTPGMMSGNEIPNWKDSQGAMPRRIVRFLYKNSIVVDQLMKDHLRTELPRIILKCNRVYRAALKYVGNESLWSKLPAYFKESRADLQAEVSPIHGFLRSGDLTIVRTASGELNMDVYIPMNTLRDKFKEWKQANDIRARGDTGKWSKDIYLKALRELGLGEPVRMRLSYPRGLGPATQRMFVYGIDTTEECERRNEIEPLE